MALKDRLRDRLSRTGASFKRALPIASKNSLCIAGLSAFDYGWWMVYHPAGFIIGGIMLIYIGLMIDKAMEKGGSNGSR